MRRNLLLACVLILAVGETALGFIGTPPSPSQLFCRIGWSDYVVIGKIEEEPAEYQQPKGGKGLLASRISVSEVIVGPKDLGPMQVAVHPLWVNHPKSWADVRTKAGPNIEPFEKGREGLFFLRRSEVAKVYSPADQLIFVDKNDPAYTKQLALTRRLARLLANPKAGLQAKDPADRLYTAAMLVWRYGTGSSGENRAPIDAEESKLILGILAEANWNFSDDPEAPDAGLVFEWLKPLEGFHPSAELKNDSSKYTQAAKQWLRDNRERYRIQRLLPVEPK